MTRDEKTGSVERTTDSPSPHELPPPEPEIGPPPDGGLEAWLVVAGSFLALGGTFGVINTFGVFQSYYTVDLLEKSSSSTISLIGALQLAFMYGSGPIVGKIFDAYGLKVLHPLGTFLSVLSLMLLSLCQRNQVYQFFLDQAILFSLGSTLIFTPSLAVIGHWFKRKRALALGIAGSGSAALGTIFPIMLQRLIPEVGFPWAVRILGFVQLSCLVVAGFCMKTRLPLRRKIIMSEIVDLGGFRDPRYCLAAFGSFLYMYAFFIPYFYIQDYATFRGVNANLATYLLPLINATSLPARIIPGFVADKIGVLQMQIPVCIASGLCVLALWLPSRGTAPIIVFSLLYGVASASYVTLLPAYIATLSPVEKYGARLGAVYVSVAIACLVGTPTAGAFVPTFTQANFTHLMLFTGILELAGGCTLFIAYLLGRPGHRPPSPTPQSEISSDSTQEAENKV